MLEMEQFHEELTFLSHPLLLPILLHSFPFHYTQTAAGKIVFSVQFCHVLFLVLHQMHYVSVYMPPTVN